MFPFQQGHELFQIPSTTHPDYNNIDIVHQQNQQDHQDKLLLIIGGQPIPHHDLLTNMSGVSRTRRHNSSSAAATEAHVANSLAAAAAGADDDQMNENDRKKLIHREIERQRRQEMSNLYSSLRSQLPVEYIKNLTEIQPVALKSHQRKRSISDHMNEAANYIKHLRNNIKELNLKKEKLKRLSSPQVQNEGMVNLSSSGTSTSSSNVQVSSCWGGVEIVITSGFRDPNSPPLPISKVLRTLQQDGFSVYSCVSTVINERVFHTIQAQVGDGSCQDLQLLQLKLSDAISS